MIWTVFKLVMDENSVFLQPKTVWGLNIGTQWHSWQGIYIPIGVFEHLWKSLQKRLLSCISQHESPLVTVFFFDLLIAGGCFGCFYSWTRDRTRSSSWHNKPKQKYPRWKQSVCVLFHLKSGFQRCCLFWANVTVSTKCI